MDEGFSNHFYKNILDNLSDGIYFVDRERKITYWNHGAEKLTGYKASEVIGKRCQDNILMHVDDEGISLCTNHCPLTKSITDGCQCDVEVYLHHKEGYRLPVFIRATPIRDADGRIVGAIEIFNDNTANIAYRQRIEALEKEALLDSLTGLVNRRFIEMSLNSKLSEMVRYRSSFGVLFIDIDNFKSINDLYGHDVGDEVLKMVAKTALNTARVFDIIGRWGGEEFVGLIANVNEEQLHAIAQRHRVLIEQSNFSRLTHVIKVTVSIGAALVQPGDTMETLLKRADQAMYESKASGRNRVSMSFSTSCKTCSS